MLVVAFALAGRIDIDFSLEPLQLDPNGEAVSLHDIWPKDDEIDALAEAHVQPVFFESEYGTVLAGDESWQGLTLDQGLTFAWDESSSYIKLPPYFDGFKKNPEPPGNIRGARALLLLGDSVTPDHISPGGAIPEEYPAGRHLLKMGVLPENFNSYGSRRGNHEVMMRGNLCQHMT